MTEIYLRPHQINGSGNIVTGNYTLIDTSADIPLPNTYQIIDLTSLGGGPGERMGGGSQTLKLPGTKNNNTIFGFIFEIDIADCIYDTRLKADCIVLQDKIQVAAGILQLQTIETVDVEPLIWYNCQLTFGYTSFISAMTGDAGGANPDFLLSDMDWSDLDHDLTHDVVSDSWTAAKGGIGYGGNGFVYPMIDYGETDLNAWWVQTFYPALYVQEIIDRIFAFTGFTYQSNFFGSDFFASLIIPFTNGQLLYSQSEIISREFKAVQATASTNVPAATLVKIPFDGTITDGGTNWDSILHAWYVPTDKGGEYSISLTAYISASAGANGLIVIYKNGTLLIDQIQFQGGGGGFSNLPISLTWTSDKLGVPTVSTNGYNVTQLYTNGTIIYPGDYFEFFVYNLNGTISFKSGCFVQTTAINDGVAEGNLVTIADALPQNILMKDFFISIVKMFNLYVDVDINNPYNLIIEPRADFYGQGVAIDWTSRLAKDKEIISTPMGMVNAKNYLFTYSSDSDYWNDFYSSLYYTLDHNEIYGERQIGTTNDFQTSNLKTDVIFAPTPLVKYGPIGQTYIISPSNQKVLSTIHNVNSKDDATGANSWGGSSRGVPFSNATIRILYYAGMIDTVAGSGVHAFDYMNKDTMGIRQSYNQYPYAGHFDDPINPTIDLNFGLVSQLFYLATGQKMTNNNLYNQYYSAFINEITDVDSKVVEMWLKLTVADINQLDFRNTFLIDKTYYKLLEITDYDMSCYQLTKCKFLKSSTIPANAIVYNIDSRGGRSAIGSSGERLPILVGTRKEPGHIKKDAINDLGGAGNNIGEGTTNVMTLGDNNKVRSGTGMVAIIGGKNNDVKYSNITLINSQNLGSGQIASDDMTFIRNVDFANISSPGILVSTGSALRPAVASDFTTVNAHTIFTPGEGGSLTLSVNQDNIISPAAPLLALTVTLPPAPNNNDFVNIKFAKSVATVTYTGGTVSDALVSPATGGFSRLVFDSGTGTWY